MEKMYMEAIGRMRCGEGGYQLILEKKYTPALRGLEGFSHIQVLWWCSQCDDVQQRGRLTETSPYKQGPAILGTFATRSPVRPNPVALSCAQLLHVDAEAAVLDVAYIDALDGTPVLDIKPYTPSLDRVREFYTPQWCNHWPVWYEDSGDFDWEGEIK